VKGDLFLLNEYYNTDVNILSLKGP
jgi:hypothetical protein